MTPTDHKYRTITLSDRAPVRIREDLWPSIASTSGDSYGSGDPSRHQQARAQGELDIYSLRVRQHQDGRAIVYGVLDAATVWTHSEDWSGGEMLAPGADLAASIRRIGEAGQLPERIIRECIADLPAVDLDN